MLLMRMLNMIERNSLQNAWKLSLAGSKRAATWEFMVSLPTVAQSNNKIHIIWIDATNSTRARRKALIDRVKKEPGICIIFIESICTEPDIIAANIKVKVASGDPDCAFTHSPTCFSLLTKSIDDGMEPEQAERDFKERIKNYEKSYQPLEEDLDRDVTYVKMINVGKQVRSILTALASCRLLIFCDRSR